jgi:hypothetical protein
MFSQWARTIVGAFKHVEADERDILKIELINDEAIKTWQEVELGQCMARVCSR